MFTLAEWSLKIGKSLKSFDIILRKKCFYPDELNNFMARMQWADKGWGNRNPQIVINGSKGINSLHVKVKAS